MAVARPFNPFLQGGNPFVPGANFSPLMSPQPMAQQPLIQPMPQRPTMTPQLMGATPMGPTQTFGAPLQVPGMGAGAAPLGVPQPGAPRQGFGQRLNDFAGSDAALAMAAGILEGGTSGQAIGRGFNYALQAKNKGAATTDDISEYAFAKQQGYDGSFLEFMKEKDARAAGADLGLNPVYYEDEQGNIRAGQLGKDGSFHPVKTPSGGSLISPYDKKFQESSGTSAGKTMGEAEGTLASMQSKMPGLEYTVGQLDKLAEKATYTMGGRLIDEAMRQTGMEPREAAVARAEYVAMVDNQILPLLRDTFGAQFTQKEGETLRATLGDPNASPMEKQAILKAFIEQKKRDIEALELQTGRPGAAPTSSGSGGWTIEEIP